MIYTVAFWFGNLAWLIFLVFALNGRRLLIEEYREMTGEVWTGWAIWAAILLAGWIALELVMSAMAGIVDFVSRGF